MAVREFAVGSRPQVEWGWLVILDFFLAGTGAGLFLISLALGSPLSMAVAVFLVLVGGALLLGDLTRPSGAWRVIARPQSSWLSRGTIGLLVFAVLGLFHIIYLLSQPKGGLLSNTAWLGVPGWERVIAVIAGLVALFIALYPGFLLGSMRAIPLWNNVLSPILFLSSALIAGLGAALFLPIRVNSLAAWSALNGSGAGLVLLQFVLLLSLVFTSQTETTRASVQRLTKGNLKLQFYIGVLLLGLIIPLALLTISLTLPGSPALLAASAVFLLLGQFLMRYTLVRAGMYVPTV